MSAPRFHQPFRQPKRGLHLMDIDQEVDRELAVLVASGEVTVRNGPDGLLYQLAEPPVATFDDLVCTGCCQPLHVDDGDLVDSVGDVHCETRYDQCGACQDGEPHPHWITGVR